MKEIYENSEKNEFNSHIKLLEFNNEINFTSYKNSSIIFLIKDDNKSNSMNSALENLSLENKLQITLNSNILNYSIKSNGRLDIYAKAHFVFSLFSALENKKANFRSNLKNLEVLKDFETMEKDLLGIISKGKAEKFNKTKLNSLIEKLAENLIARNNDTKIIRDLKSLLVLYQNINDQESLKYVENLLVKLMGHPEVYLISFLMKKLDTHYFFLKIYFLIIKYIISKKLKIILIIIIIILYRIFLRIRIHIYFILFKIILRQNNVINIFKLYIYNKNHLN